MPNQFTNPWKEEDIRFIEKNIQSLTYKQMGNILHRTAPSIQSKVRSLSVSKKVKKHRINSNFFKTWSSEMAYVLGFIAADGNVCKTGRAHTLHIACDDKDVIEKIKVALDYAGPIYGKPRSNGKISYNLRICDPVIYHDLGLLHITQRKSHSVSPPAIPKLYIRDYLRGYFDGDGSVCLRKSAYTRRLTVYIYTASESMATFIHQLSKEVAGDTYNGKIRTALTPTSNTYYAVRLGHNASVKLFSYMYNGSILYMERKYNTFLKGVSNGS